MFFAGPCEENILQISYIKCDFHVIHVVFDFPHLKFGHTYRSVYVLYILFLKKGFVFMKLFQIIQMKTNVICNGIFSNNSPSLLPSVLSHSCIQIRLFQRIVFRRGRHSHIDKKWEVYMLAQSNNILCLFRCVSLLSRCWKCRKQHSLWRGKNMSSTPRAYIILCSDNQPPSIKR